MPLKVLQPPRVTQYAIKGLEHQRRLDDDGAKEDHIYTTKEDELQTNKNLL
tara:strand:+ start:1065 stop:1217 length:153 start_codon:yes stop_codon:yes gene_type:complete